MDLSKVKSTYISSVRNETRTVEIFVGYSVESVEALALQKAKKIERLGFTVEWPDHSKTWITHEADWDLENSDYFWHEDGERVRIERIRKTKHADGTITEQKIPSTWRAYDNV